MISLEVVERASQVRLGARTQRPAMWVPGLPAIVRACERLGVCEPVVISEVNYDRGRWAGMHGFEGGVHRISVARWCDPAYASRILWHELRHAEQSERMGHAAFNRDYMRYGRKGASYFANPYEVEARATERLHEWLPLMSAPR